MKVESMFPRHSVRARVHHPGRAAPAATFGPFAGDVPAATAPRALVHHQHADDLLSWTATASACDAMGCAVDAPAPLEPGTEVLVELENEQVGAPTFHLGFVRSCSDAPPWRMRITFDAVGMLMALRYF